jgi:hypothetical protein
MTPSGPGSLVFTWSSYPYWQKEHGCRQQREFYVPGGGGKGGGTNQLTSCLPLAEQGGNFIDTAEAYPVPMNADWCGDTETIIGNWLKKSGCRDDIIIATKVHSCHTLSHALRVLAFHSFHRYCGPCTVYCSLLRLCTAFSCIDCSASVHAYASIHAHA